MRSEIKQEILEAARREIRHEILQDTRREIREALTLLKNQRETVDSSIQAQSLKSSHALKSVETSIEKLRLAQQAITMQLDEVKHQASTASRIATDVRDQVSEIQEKSLAPLGYLKSEVSRLESRLDSIPKIDRRVKIIEQEIIKVCMQVDKAMIPSSNNNSDVVPVILGKMEKMAGDLTRIQEVNLDLANSKVDMSVLEDLLKHIATRQDLKKALKKAATAPPLATLSAGDTRMEERLMDRIDQKLSLALSQDKQEEEILYTRLHPRLEEALYTQIQARVESSVISHVARIQSSVSEIQKLVTAKPPQRQVDYFDPETDEVYASLRRDFDEKLYLICNDLAECKAAWKLAAQNPLQRSGCWLWTSQTVKLGSAVPWNIESLNTDPENFRWDSNASGIRVLEAGLYEISFAFFTKAKPSVQLVVNGESVLSAINSPSYVVHHGSGFVVDGFGRMQEGSVSGLSCLDFIALPAKSSVSLHYHGKKEGHGFLSLRRM